MAGCRVLQWSQNGWMDRKQVLASVTVEALIILEKPVI
jgi:hypothetical protein